MGSLSDEDLINDFFSTGDRSIADDLFRRYRSLVFGVSAKFLDNKADCMDVTMTVFEKILRLKTSTEVKDFPNWLYTLTKHTCLDFLEKRKKTAVYNKEFRNFQKSEELVVEYGDDDSLITEGETKFDDTDIKEALKKLEPDQRTCIELFFFKKMRYRMIEETTGIPEKQVKSLLQNGKKKLKRILLKQKTRKWKNKN